MAHLVTAELDDQQGRDLDHPAGRLDARKITVEHLIVAEPDHHLEDDPVRTQGLGD